MALILTLAPQGLPAMEILNFETLKEDHTSKEAIESFVNANVDGFILRLTIEQAHHYSDLSYHYLEAAYIGQECARYAETISYNLNPHAGYHPVADLGFRPADIPLLATKIHFLAELMAGDYDTDDWSDHVEHLEEFREKLHTLPIAFPMLADDYMANHINGEYYEIQGNYGDEETAEKEFFAQEFKEFPERQFQFWQMMSAGHQNKVYGSTNAWIIPPGSDLQSAIADFSDMDPILFEPAELFIINNISYLTSKGLLVYFPFDELLRARACCFSAIEKPGILEKNDWINSMLTYHRRFNPLEPPPETADYEYHKLLNTGSEKPDINDGQITRPSSSLQYFVSSFGGQALVKDGDYQYLIWEISKPNQHELLLLNQKLSEIFLTSTRLAGIVAEISCPWGNLNDEQFEELCMDIICCNPTFNQATLRKMGKSRSRDGGRDIEVWTHRRLGYQAEKYIFQCKLQKTGTSLTAKKVMDISDIVDQFGAGGYGVMTNVVIDSTLYDKLDRLAAGKNIRIDAQSVYNLERTLILFPQLREKYFGKLKNDNEP